MGNIANRYKSASTQNVEELLRMPNLNIAVDLEAKMSSETRSVEAKRSVVRKSAPNGNDAERYNRKPLSKNKSLVGARVSEDLVNAFRAHSDNYAKAVEEAMYKTAVENGWL